jgi:tetrapyrrole methylase family protein / MazG family protein
MTDSRLAGVQQILEVMDRLRGDNGCPWDRAQSHESLRPYLLEETYEVLEALDDGKLDDLRLELGDLLFQVVFHARLSQEKGQFDFGDVAQAIADKLISRHPHVFGDLKVETSEEVLMNWEQLKKKERGPNSSVLDGVPKALPSLARCQRLQDKASRVGFDWPDVAGPLDKVLEELGELKAEIASNDKERIGEELGDLLFSVVAVARHLEVNAEDVLREASGRFDWRFREMEKSQSDLTGCSADELEDLWEQAKSKEQRSRSESNE